MPDIMDIEKIPPQNMEAEKSLLGSILVDKDAMIKIADDITADDFYKNAHTTIYETMAELYGKNEPIDLLTLSARLEEKNHQCEKRVVRRLRESSEGNETSFYKTKGR